MLFHLAMTFGLEEDAVAALERMAGFVEDLGERHGVEHPLQMSVAVTDGQRVVAARYSSERQSRSLFFSTDARALKQMYPKIEELQLISDTRAPSSPSHSATCRGLGTKCPSPMWASSSRASTSCVRSLPAVAFERIERSATGR